MEITDDLVRYITDELLKRLARGGEAAPADRPRLLLVGDPRDLSPPVLAEIRRHFEVLTEPPADPSEPFEASVLLTRLGLQALVRVAEGEAGCTPEGLALMAALLHGRPAVVLKSGLVWHRHRGAAPRALLDRYARCENSLTSYGVRLAEEGGLIAALVGREPAAAPPSGPRPGRRRVLSETEVRAACPAAGGPGQILNLEPGALLTPLARDYVLSMKIALVRN
jgi:hypothetical protein